MTGFGTQALAGLVAGRSGYHPAGEPKSRGIEPYLLVFVFFAFFAVNLDCSFQVAPKVPDLLVGKVDVHFAWLGGVAAAVGDLPAGVILPRVGAEGGAVQTVVQRLRLILGDTRDDGL